LSRAGSSSPRRDSSARLGRRVPAPNGARVSRPFRSRSQLEAGGDFRFDPAARLLASGSSETEQADRRLDRDCCSPWRCRRIGDATVS
jgi:hypothetical protein